MLDDCQIMQAHKSFLQLPFEGSQKNVDQPLPPRFTTQGKFKNVLAFLPRESQLFFS